MGILEEDIRPCRGALRLTELRRAPLLGLLVFVPAVVLLEQVFPVARTRLLALAAYAVSGLTLLFLPPGTAR